MNQSRDRGDGVATPRSLASMSAPRARATAALLGGARAAPLSDRELLSLPRARGGAAEGAQLRLSRPIACEWGLRREGLFPLPRCSRVRWAAPGGRYRRCRSRPGPSAATLGQKAAAHNFLARPILPASGWAELRKGSPQPLAHFNIGFSSFFCARLGYQYHGQGTECVRHPRGRLPDVSVALPETRDRRAFT